MYFNYVLDGLCLELCSCWSKLIHYISQFEFFVYLQKTYRVAEETQYSFFNSGFLHFIFLSPTYAWIPQKKGKDVLQCDACILLTRKILGMILAQVHSAVKL